MHFLYSWTRPHSPTLQDPLTHDYPEVFVPSSLRTSLGAHWAVFLTPLLLEHTFTAFGTHIWRKFALTRLSRGNRIKGNCTDTVAFITQGTFPDIGMDGVALPAFICKHSKLWHAFNQLQFKMTAIFTKYMRMHAILCRIQPFLLWK